MSTDQPGATGTQAEEITHDVRDGVAWITLNRPQAGNSITADQRELLIGWLEQANADHDVRCVVIGATGRFFCTGADLRQPSAAKDDGGDDTPPEKVVGDVRRMMLGGTIRLMNAVLDCEKPVIAAVQGTAAGIGAHLALCCDLVIASEEAKLIEVFARRGLAVDGLGSWLLPRLVGLLRAKELVLLAEDIPARRAEELGLVTRVVAAEDLQATVEELAGRLAEGPTRALAASKWMLNRSMDLDRHAMAQEEAWIVDSISRTHDADEGVASYVERRPTRFIGR
jgi:2-(1,2-epoxy-1,2-dihydrophenyl)acetyl-CoA isomerase